MKNTILFLLLIPAALVAQNGGSVLSRFGVGELDNLSTARQRAMGNSGSAITSGFDVHATNPAAWSFVNGLRLQGNTSYEYESSSKDAALSYGSFTFKSLQFVLPLEENWRSRLVAGIHSLSTIGYEVSAKGSTDGRTFNAGYAGEGGLAFASVGTGLQPLPSLSIGLAMRWYFGSIDQRMSVDFDDANYFDAEQRLSSSHSGGGYLFGAAYTGIGGLTISASAATAAELDVSRDLHVQYSTHDSTIRGADGIQDIPVRYQGGFSYEINPRLLVAADVAVQDWTGARVFGTTQSELTSSYRIGAGAEWKLAGDGGQGMLRSTLLRFGFTHQRLPVLLDGVVQTETLGTLGLGIPVFGESRADMALEAGLRGVESDILGSRLMIRFSVSVSVGENWFVRRDTE